MRADVGREVLAADFFLSLGQHDDVDRQRSANGEMRLERFHVQEQLAFIVHRASRVDPTFAKRRFERRRFPQLERLGGLDVVVAVYEHRRCARRLTPFTQYYGMAARGKDSRLESNSRERVAHPL